LIDLHQLKNLLLANLIAFVSHKSRYFCYSVFKDQRRCRSILGVATRRTTYSSQFRLSITFFSSNNLFFQQLTFQKSIPAETIPLLQKGLAFYHKLFETVKLKMMLSEKYIITN